jgi:hypothetical protein
MSVSDTSAQFSFTSTSPLNETNVVLVDDQGVEYTVEPFTSEQISNSKYRNRIIVTGLTDGTEYNLKIKENVDSSESEYFNFYTDITSYVNTEPELTDIVVIPEQEDAKYIFEYKAPSTSSGSTISQNMNINLLDKDGNVKDTITYDDSN